MNTPESVTGASGRAPVEVVEASDAPRRSQETRCRADELHMDFIVEKKVAKARARRRTPYWRSRLDATQASVADGVDAATSAWVPGTCNRGLGQGLTGGEAKLHGDLVGAAQERKLSS